MFAGAYADDLFDRLDPNLAVSNGTGASSVADDVDNAVDMFIGADEGELHLGDGIDEQFVAANVFLPAMLCTWLIVMPRTSAANSASLRTSSFSWRTIAVIFFIVNSSLQ